jgi:cytoskeletal protein RodZ
VLEIGSSLRSAREGRGLSLDDAAEATKIRPAYLAAIEDEAFERLPGPTYARGFLRAYAEFLGVDAQPLIDEFSERFATAPWELDEDVMFPRRRGPRAEARASRASGMIVVAIAGIVAVAVLVVIASTYPSTRETPLPATDAGTTVVTVTEAAVNPVATAVTAATEPQTTAQQAPVTLRLKPLAQVTVTVRALDEPDAIPPIFQEEIEPDEDAPQGILVPRSTTGYSVRLDRPGTLVLEVNGKQVVPGESDTLLTIDPDGRVAAAE